MSKRYFTVDEANGAVPVLAETFGRILRVRTQLKVIYQRLKAAHFAPTSDDFDPILPDAPAAVIKDRVALRSLIEVLKGEVAVVQGCGCVIKDLETGLVDWPGRSGRKDVLLCWRLGEKAVDFFHDLDAGFSGRRPIGELVPPQLDAAERPTN